MVIKVRIFRRKDAKYEIEVEVAPGLTFDEMVWLFETVYRLVTWFPRYGGGYSLLTLFSPPHYRVTNRWMHGAVYHGWTKKDCEQTSAAENDFQGNLHCPICDVGLDDQGCEHQFFGISMEGHRWDRDRNPDCVECQKESEGRKFVECWNPAQILPAPSRAHEIEVEPGLSYFEMHGLLNTSYREALKRGQRVSLYSPPHNRLIPGTVFPCCDVDSMHEHPDWVKTEFVKSCALEGGLPGALLCPDCPKLFEDALVLPCGHSIRHRLLSEKWKSKEDPPCPGCYEEAYNGSLEPWSKCESKGQLMTCQEGKIKIQL